MRIQISVDNTVYDMRYETKLENFLLSETLLFFLERKYILFSETYFFEIPKNLITSAFFFLPR